MKLFEGSYMADGVTRGRKYDVAPDGQRFLMIKSLSETPPMVVVQYFDQELKRLMPTK